MNDPSRLGSLDPNLRLCWWEEALDVYSHHGPEGAGAGTFEIARKRFRQDARSVVQPHSVPLQHLADGGVVGLGLFVALVLAAGGVVRLRASAARRGRSGPRRRRSSLRPGGVRRPRARRLQLGLPRGDGADDARARRPRRRGSELRAPDARRPLLAVGVILVAAPCSSRSRSRGSPIAPSGARPGSSPPGTPRRARDQALWARFFNPLSAEPLLALARVAERQGRVLRAEREYIRAVELQPENPETWYTLGIFQFDVRDNLCAAYRYLNDAYTLDPAGNQWVDGGPLDVARDAVNAAGARWALMRRSNLLAQVSTARTPLRRPLHGRV